MNFSFSGRHMEIGESLTARAEELCNNLAQKYEAKFLDVNIVMKKENYLFLTDISVKGASGTTYQSSDSDTDPVDSFQKALQKIEVQIRKRKKTHKGCGKEAVDVEINNFDNSFENKNNEKHPVIVAEILDDLPLLSVSEATKKLNDKQRVFIFENIANNTVNVVYIREDGNFGWIDYKTRIH